LLASVAISGSAAAGSVLTATVTMANIPLPRGTTIKVEWYRNASNSNVGGTLITTSTLALLANPGEGQQQTSTYTTVDADIGNWIYAVAYASNARGTGAPSVVSTPIGAVTAVAPAIASVSLSGTFTEGNTVSASPNYSQIGHPAPSLTYQWQYSTDGSTGWTNIATATSQTYTLDTTYAGYFLRCNITATNSAGSSGPVSSAASARVGTLYFGDGRDGDVTISSSQSIAGGKQYRNLTIGAGTLVLTVTGSGLIQVCRTYTPDVGTNVTWSTNGANGQNMTSPGGASQAGGTGGVGGVGGGGNGGDGGGFTSPSTYSNGQNGNAATGVSSDGDSGAGATTGSSATSGSGVTGTASSNPSTKTHVRDNTNNWGGGPGGGGQGGYHLCIKGCTDGGGGGGGGGGGFLRFMALSMVNTGVNVFQANAGNGGTGGGFAGGGGGGGGRVWLVTYDSSIGSSYTMQANGGTGGTAGTAGNTGSLTGVGP
jgi:hypothetical protein